MRKTLLILSLVLFSHPLFAKTPLSEQQALAIVIEKVKDDALYSAWTKMECLGFETEKVSAGAIDIAVREIHKDNCPGDPDTAPIVDRFRILRSSRTLLWYNVIEDDFVDYDAKNIRR